MNQGKIYIVATPIGNLNDISLRAIEVLKKVEIIFCEDTRTSSILMKKYEIKTKLSSLHKFNELSKEKYFRELLNDNKDIAIISDAGTPLISDPGQFIISKIKNDFEIIVIPGANAIISSLIGSGLIFDSFAFLGFIPKEKTKIENLINKNLNIDLLVFYDSPKRIKDTLTKIKSIYGDIEITIARELTKKYEENNTLIISSWLMREIKGEIVLIIDMKKIRKEIQIFETTKKIILFKKEGLRNKTIAKLLENNIFTKNEIYKKLLELDKKEIS